MALNQEISEAPGGRAQEPDRAFHLHGNLEAFRAFELFDYLSQLGKSGWVTLRERGGQRAKVALLDGRVAAAECGHRRGAEAVLTLLRWNAGWFEFELGRPASGRETWNVSALNLEAARLADEAGRRQDGLPAAGSRLTLAGAPASPLDDPLGCGLTEIVEALAAAPGLTLEQLEARVPLCPAKVRLGLALLAQAGRLAEAAPELGAELERRFPAGLRLLVAEKLDGGAGDLSSLTARLGERLGAPMVSPAASPWGPVFLRFRRDGGTLLSLTVLPIDRRNRYLFDNFARSAGVVLLRGRAGSEGREWAQAAPGTVDLETVAPAMPLETAVLAKLEKLVATA